MTVDDTLRLEVWGPIAGREDGPLGIVGAPTAVSGVLRHNAISELDVAVTTADPAAELLDNPAAWVELWLRGERRFTGPVVTTDIAGPYGSLQASCQSHLRWLWRSVIEPGQPVTPVTTDGVEQYRADREYRQVSGPAETVLKTYAGVATGWRPIIATDQGRGGQVTATMRMHSLGDRLLPQIAAAGLGVSLVADGPRRVLDVYQPKRLRAPLTDSSGAVASWKVTRERPGGTAVIIGGQGEAKDRLFARLTPATSAPVDDRGTVFKDARNQENPDLLAPQARDELAALATKRGLSAVLAENETLRYGIDYVEGDWITAELMGGTLVISEQITEVEFSWTVDKGLVCVPVVGERKDDQSDETARLLAGMNRRLGGLERR